MTIPRNEIAAERRKRRAIERLKSTNPVCTICGETFIHALERHHIAGKDNDEATVIVCRNCHRKLENKKFDHSAETENRGDKNFPIAKFLLGLADFFELLIAKLREFAAVLIGPIEGAA